jgi:hypothetical protein
VQWNERLFEEMLKAYLEGRSATDPSESWYKGVRCLYRMHQRFLVVSSSAGLTCVDWGLLIFLAVDQELGFFDFYIIPLAKKLDSCGV